VIAFLLGLAFGSIMGAFILALVTAGKLADLDNDVALWRARARHTAGFGDGE
jgi:hypothetical protein